MPPHNVVAIYKEWVNSVFCEEGIQIENISQLSSDNLLMRLYELVTNTKNEADLKLLNSASSLSSIEILESVTSLLRLLRADGIRTSLQPSDLVSGDFQSLLEIIWILILNYGIHTAGQNASHQRTLSIGTKLLLRWCSELLGGACFDYRLSMTENMEKDVLHNIINNVGNLVSKDDEPEPCDYHEAIAEAERKLGVSSSLLRVCDTQTENLAVTVYISLLRRKQQLIIKGNAPTQPTVLVSQQSRSIASTLCRSNLLMHNDRTQQVLKDIEKQLSAYQNGFSSSARVSSSPASSPYKTTSAPPLETASRHRRSFGDDSHSVASSSTTLDSTNMPSPIARAHGSFPNESHDCLKIDLGPLQQRASNKGSCSTSSTPRQQAADGSFEGRRVELTTDFAELLRQCKDKEKGENSGGGERDPNLKPSQLPDPYIDDEEADRTSPKSAPNTDEGFGTFTKTTPRGKDSASEGSDDHTDCEVDHLTAEPSSITEWWDRIEMPTEAMNTLDSSMFQRLIDDHTVSRVEVDGSIELGDDELMCVLDSIGLNGVKSSSGLASAQETELRLLYILKERDDLVMSYHNALKELSKLTARIKDENHSLRTQLNLTDLSHNEIVLALEEQASDGRQLALSLQDDLTDTEVNVMARLREDKHVLEDRLAALEHQYNCDIAKWQGELAAYKSKQDSDQTETGEVTRENHMLKLQMDELRNMFDVTMSRTQDECSNYLQTIEQLKEEISNGGKAPISESQLESLAQRQAEMEKLYESMISSLEGDNSKLRSDLEELQLEISKLKQEKERHDMSCGTDSTHQVNRSMNTSLSQSTKGTEMPATQTAVKSVCTGEDPRIVELQGDIAQLEMAAHQSGLDKNSLEQQNSRLFEDRGRLGERLASVESQLQLTVHKLTTLQAVHELVLGKNESLERSLGEANSKLSTETSLNATLKQRISSELERARTESHSLNLEISSLRQHVVSLQAECDGHRQREVEMNSELTKLTLERSNLQGKVNSLNSDLVQQKGQHMSQSLQIQRLEASKAKLESQAEAFKHDSLELFKQLDEARQEKDVLSQQLSALHSQLAESMSNWQSQHQLQQSDHSRTKSLLESELSTLQNQVAAFKSEKERMSAEADQLRLQLRNATDTADNTKCQLGDVLRTARLDQSTENVLVQLNDQLKDLQKQSAESRFSLTHFKSENSRLQLRVNQLEEINQATEQRSQIFQKELATVQSSLDDSYSSADAHLNLLELSSSDLMSIDDTSELRNYILAAKRQVEMMQKNRAKTNIEYSRKIAEMENLVKQRSRVLTSGPDPRDGPQSINGSDSMSATTEFVKLPARVDMNESYCSATIATGLLLNNAKRPIESHMAGLSAESHAARLFAENRAAPPQRVTSRIQTTPISRSYTATTSTSPPNQKHLSAANHEVGQLYRLPSDSLYAGQASDSSYPTYLASVSSIASDVSDNENYGVTDSLSLKVRSLTNRPGTSTPNHPLSPREVTKASIAKHTAIECENAALKAELELINSDRSSLHQHMKSQTLQHDVLNTTLDELERSLEEVYDSNRLLKNTLGDCNDFIQTNILSEPVDTFPAHGHRSAAIRPTSVGPTIRPHHMTPSTRSRSMTPSLRPHSMTAATRPHSVTPATRSYGTTLSTKTSSMTPVRNAGSDTSRSFTDRVSVSTPYSVSFGGREVNTYDGGEDGRVDWSPQSDRHLTSSSEFNKLQQTNVQNYESLLLSDTNNKSPTRGSVSASRTTDLNHMIQHSLSRLGQVNSLSSGSPPVLSSSGFTSPLSRTSATLSRYDSRLPGSTAAHFSAVDSANSAGFHTARQFTSTPVSHHTSPPPTARLEGVSSQPRMSANHSHAAESSLKYPQRPDRRRPLGQARGKSRRFYSDGGPGPDEPKSVLPEPLRIN